MQTQAGIHQAMVNRQDRFSANRYAAQERREAATEHLRQSQSARQQRLQLAQKVFEQSTREINGDFDTIELDAQTKLTAIETDMERYQR